MSNPERPTLILFMHAWWYSWTTTVDYEESHECKRKTLETFWSLGCVASIHSYMFPVNNMAQLDGAKFLNKGQQPSATKRHSHSSTFTVVPHPTTPLCHFFFQSLLSVSIKSVCTHRPFRDFKVQRWLQGRKLSIPLTSLDRPGGWQIKSLKPKQQRISPLVCASPASVRSMCFNLAAKDV